MSLFSVIIFVHLNIEVKYQSKYYFRYSDMSGTERVRHLSGVGAHRPPSSPSASLRRNSYCEPSDSSSIYTPGGAIQRSYTQDRHLAPSRIGSGTNFQDLASTRSETSYNNRLTDNPVRYNNRYSLVSEEPHDWGFRSLRRRNSKVSPSKLLNDDINI